MKTHQTAHYLIVILVFICNSKVFSQDIKEYNDSTFSVFIDKVSVDLQQHNYSDSLQKKYSNEFYLYFVNYPKTKIGHEALWRAFLLWGNLGEAEKMDIAMSKIDYDSNIWRRIIVPISNAYHLSEHKTKQDYILLLEKLKNNLIDLKSKSEVLYALARHYNKINNNQKVIELAREMIEINASDFYVEKALGFQHEVELLSVGSLAPYFKAKTVQGNLISLAALKGKIVVLEFWATWCGPCIPDIPYLKSINSKYSKNVIQIIGISLDDNTKNLIEFLNNKGMNWPQIIQPKQWDDKITNSYNVYVIPRNFIIDQNGVIVAKNIRGKKLEAELKNYLN